MRVLYATLLGRFVHSLKLCDGHTPNFGSLANYRLGLSTRESLGSQLNGVCEKPVYRVCDLVKLIRKIFRNHFTLRILLGIFAV